jgi:4-amino-4-deoxy-L-arabinose transferase-like glycosyltransferase
MGNQARLKFQVSTGLDPCNPDPEARHVEPGRAEALPPRGHRLSGFASGIRWQADSVLLAVIALAAVLRLWGLGYGLPHVYNPDEVSIMSRALSLAQSGLNPHNFVYPSFYFYVLAAAVGAWYVVLYGLGRVGSLGEFEAAFWADPTAIYLIGRGLSATAGVLTVAAVYVLARKIGDRTLARVAAVLMAAAYIPIRDAHFVKHDVPVTLLIVLVVLAGWSVWRLGRLRDSVLAGALAGAAFATHYYAVFAVVPVAAAHLLRPGSLPALLQDRRPWIAAGTFALAFACLSPYVLLDWDTAWRDILANRQIVVGRGLATYGPFGAGLEHLRLFVTQGGGLAMLVAAAAGVTVVARRSWSEALWLFSFPAVFFLFISNAWPFGRLQNPLYPFAAIAAAAAIVALARRTRPSAVLTVALTIACVAQPLVLAVIMDRLMTRTDTRTLARNWIETHVPSGAGVAIQPYSVPLEPTRERLLEAVTRRDDGFERVGYRTRRRLHQEPYPDPAYRLYHLGAGGLDEDKIFYDPTGLLQPGALDALRADGLEYVVLKRFTVEEPDPLRDRVASAGHLAFRVSPFRRPLPHGPAQMPDYDIRPSLAVERPGPIVEVWRLDESGTVSRPASPLTGQHP